MILCAVDGLVAQRCSIHQWLICNVQPFLNTDLTVTIVVDYTPPVDFDRPSESDYRAGSGPVTLTCQVEGATGSVTYQWTSTCTGACFIFHTLGRKPSVTQPFLRASVDDGTHTCTATDSDGGEIVSASTVMRIIGTFVSSLLCTGIMHSYVFVTVTITYSSRTLQRTTSTSMHNTLSRGRFGYGEGGSYIARLYM